MRRERFLWSATTVAAVVLGLGSVAWAAQAAKVDVTGAWTFTVESAAGSSTPAVTFKQEGEKLTGHYSSALLGEAELTGTVKGQTIEFVVSADVQGTKLQLKYTGTIENKDSMKGKLSLAEFGDGTFTAKRN
jgi:hypothetical protein